MTSRYLMWPIALVLAVLASACGGSSPPGSPKSASGPATAKATVIPRVARYASHRDLAYADGVRTIDLYLPSRGAPAPVVVWLHGGSWVAGDKVPVPPVVLDLRDRGFAIASVNYRLTGLSTYPAQLHDVKGSIRWLRAHANEYGFDPARVYLVGFSAGGHLASLAALTSGDATLEGDVGGNREQSSAVAGVVAYAGPSDIGRLVGECTGCEVSEQFQALGCSFLLCGDRARGASPLTYAKAGAPPFLLLHGSADRVVPPEQSRLLDGALRGVGVSSRLIVVAGGEHGLLDDNANEAARGFLLGLAGLGR